MYHIETLIHRFMRYLVLVTFIPILSTVRQDAGVMEARFYEPSLCRRRLLSSDKVLVLKNFIFNLVYMSSNKEH